MRALSRIADELGCARRARAKLERRVRIVTRNMTTAMKELTAIRGQEDKKDEASAWMRTYSQLSEQHSRLTLKLNDAQEHQDQLQTEYEKWSNNVS